MTDSRLHMNRLNLLKIVAFAMVLLFTVFSVATAFAADDSTYEPIVSGDFKYVVNKDGTITISQYNGLSETVKIPSKLDGKTVTGVGYDLEYVFNPNYKVKTLVFPKSIKEFTVYTLAGRIDIQVDPSSPYFTEDDGVIFSKDKKTILRYSPTKDDPEYVMPNSVKVIGTSAFENSKLENIVCSKNLAEIGHSGFGLSQLLRSIKLNEGLKSIGTCAFQWCESLEKIVFPKSLTTIGISVFIGCNSLKSINIPATLTDIQGAPFPNCAQLKSITVDAKNPKITIKNGVMFGDKGKKLVQYFGNESNKTYTVPKGVKEISFHAFRGAFNLEKIILPSGVSLIDSCAFWICTNLSSINLPDSITEIKYGTFMGCKNLSDVKLPSKLKKIGEFSFERCEKINKTTIPSTVESIESRAFRECTSLTEIKIPKAVKSIGVNAFSNTPKLTKVTFEGDAPKMGSDVFSDSECTIYYSASAKGFTTPEWQGRPCYPIKK